MIHRIVITGAESTGKTSLARALSERYAEPWTKEFVRDYVDSLTRELNAGDLDPIARGQFEIEDTGTERAQKLIIHDTNILSSIIYAKHYFATALDWVDDHFKKRSYSLYLLCMPDIPWQADHGQRESAEARDQLHALFKEQLVSLELPYVEISGSREARLKQAIKAIDEVIEP